MCYTIKVDAQPSTLILNAENGVSKEELINQRLGVTIAKKRKSAGYTQDEVAERLGIGTEAFSRIERGMVGVSVFKLYELADMFGCGVESFLIESSRRPSEQVEYLTQMLSGLSIVDRQFIVQIVEKLVRKFKGDRDQYPKKSRTDSDN